MGKRSVVSGEQSTAHFLYLTGKAGEDRPIAKPFSLGVLFQVVEEVMRRTPVAQAA